jgi:hypothetical protein
MSTVASSAAIWAYESGSTPCSCTSRAAKIDSSIAITRKPMLSRRTG